MRANGRRRWRSTLAAAVVLASALASGATAGYWAAHGSAAGQAATNCADYIVIDSRGSGEETTLSKPGSVFVGFFRAAVKRRDPEARVAVIPNGYPAWGSLPTLVSALFKLPQRYDQSVVEGKDWLSGQISTLRTKCLDTKLILVGYSQGAQVTGDVYQEHSFSNILGVVLFGDPKFNSADPAARGGKVGLDGALGTRPLYSRKPGTQSIGRVLSYCHEGDPVCQGVSRLTLAGMKLAHGSYGATDEPQNAANYLARFVSSASSNEMLSVVGCPGSLQGGPAPKAPDYMKPGVRLSPSIRSTTRYYQFGGAAALAPLGFRCSGAGGSNGDQVTAFNPKAGTHVAIRDNQSISRPNAAVYLAVSSIGPWSVRAACQWFAQAAQKYEQQERLVCHPSEGPPGTRVSRPAPGVVRIIVPARASSPFTTFSGGPNPAIVQVWWIPAAKNKFNSDAAQTAVCVLPQSQSALCGAILSDLGSRFRTAIGAR